MASSIRALEQAADHKTLSRYTGKERQSKDRDNRAVYKSTATSTVMYLVLKSENLHIFPRQHF